METVTKAIITMLLNKRYIGKKHFPENKLIISRTKWLTKQEIKLFEKEYKEIINKKIILKSKKRTGKGSEWHISLNPEQLEEIYNLLGI